MGAAEDLGLSRRGTDKAASAAEALLGGGGAGNHRGKLLWGERGEREAYVAKYGYEDTLDVINSALEKNKELKDPKHPQSDWYSDMIEYRNELLSRQGS